MFTADNIAAVLAAIPQSNGTYADIVANAQQHGAEISPHTVSRWVTQGRRDIAHRKNTALARFTKHFDDRLKEHCGPETNRNRELDQALFMLERRCECGQEKMLDSNGHVADQCRNCAEIDRASRRNKTPPTGRRDHTNGALPVA